MRSITDPPPRSAAARFDVSFGQRFLLTVDTARELDGNRPPLAGEVSEPPFVARLAKFQALCEEEGVVPVYLADWRIARSEEAGAILRDSLTQGKAEIGVQLDPLVTPPFEEGATARAAFAGNLPPELEEAKFRNLRAAIERNFEMAPAIYRAARHGAGPRTGAMLAAGGIAVDSSARAKFDYRAEGGPNYRRHPLAPYWLDEGRLLLELPTTTVFWGMLRRQGDWIDPALPSAPCPRRLLTRMGLLERIPLSPEDVSVEAAIRAIDMALDDGLPLLVFTFHGPSLAPGHTPHVRDEADLAALHDWWRRVFAYLALRGVAPATVAQVMQAVER